MRYWYNKNKYTLVIVYEVVMLMLVTFSLITIFISDEPHPILHTINRVVWVIFLIDLIVRVLKSVSKWKYIKKNPADVVAIIPLEDVFLLARFARLIKLFRYKNLVKRYLGKLDTRIQKYSLLKITVTTLTLIVLLTIIITLTTQNSYIETTEWVVRNIFQFNYISDTIKGSWKILILSIILKVYGLLYMGIVISRVLNIIKTRYELYKEEREEG